MLILVINEEKELEKPIDESNFSELGVWERTHMEEWIVKHPKILGEELLPITTEYDRFDKTRKRLDILAVDKNGKLVVIELKRDIADKFVDLQAIHYAAYCSTLTLEQIVEIRSEFKEKPKDEMESRILDFIKNPDFTDFDNQPRIILVANDFNEETLAAVLWLRDIGVDITCVKLEAYRLDKKIIITPDVIIPLPEAKQFMIYREEKTKNIISQQTNEMSQFWSKVLKHLRELKPEIPERRPYKSTYFPIYTEYKNVHFEWMLRKRPFERLMVCLHFETRDKDYNKKLLDCFGEKKNEIEEKLGNETIFDENFGNQWMQIYIQKESAELSDENIQWCAETMAEFYSALKPILDECMTAMK